MIGVIIIFLIAWYFIGYKADKEWYRRNTGGKELTYWGSLNPKNWEYMVHTYRYSDRPYWQDENGKSVCDVKDDEFWKLDEDE